MRKAIALIELIFSIVIIALALTAVPNLISITTKSTKSAISQEAISNAAAHASMVMSQYWDEKDTNASIGNVILTTDSTNTKLKPPTSSTTPPTSSMFHYLPHVFNPIDTSKFIYKTRLGSFSHSNRQYYIDNNGNYLHASNIIGIDTDDNNTPDDIDDYNSPIFDYTLITHTGEDTNSSEGEYKDNKVKIKTRVTYVNDNYTLNGTTISFSPDNNTTQITNIKLITVTITSVNNPNEKIILKSFSSNIGGTDIKARTF